MSHHRMHPYGNHQHMQRQPEQPRPEEENAEAPEEQAPQENAQPEEEAQPEAVENEKDSLEEARKELEDMRLRMAAEMDNYKKRLQREHQEQMRYAGEKVLGELLPALDNLDLAIQYAPDNEACAEMMKGIEMTRKQLLDAVGRHGLVSVGQEGEEFNPEIHEAIGMESRPDLEKGHVSKVLQRGYKLNDRLLRAAKVMVNN